ncbi:hypothetical protein DXA61_18795 [Bacteroides intestinalis]|jgi:hypothetical protein|uniref:Uncharacterized protein n=1 Tax=Bacteroides intestinalis TaxID=329854 RepID=A0A415NAC6_9BACE|nr:hypothetical protein DWX27_10555 [Bacteroides intestinalis]RGX83249.1 hypothetical protein DXA61_18795 [Bacteroides intestinalis]RHE82597.1 hypothetical protein DW715_08490 [Bacteroides intestinalis]RHL93554.1 hypothetical protein DWZ95_09560 [Bacteroides intestinalis]RYT81162.1 hypothetical protein EAJ06_07455 [Bacteroides intestinalis]
MNQSIYSRSTGFYRQRYNGPEINLWDLVCFTGLIGKIFFPSWRNIFSQVGKKQSSAKLAKLANLQVVTATAPKVLCF